MKDSKILTENQENIFKSYGYYMSLCGENMEVWKLVGDDLMVDVFMDNDKIMCNIWISETNVKEFSAKRLNQFLKRYAPKNL